MVRLWPLVLLALAVLLTACGSADGPGSGAGAQASGETVESSPAEDVPSALDDPFAEGLPEPTLDMDRVQQLLPADGIPAIDDPTFLETGEADFVDDREPVLAVEVDGDARAYPVQILTWHEIVNDTIGGRPITVSFCPLCNSALAYDRRVGDRVLDFGTSGKLLNSALVMYDRQTESLWSHFTAEAFAGVLTGEQLDTIPVAMLPWEDWARANPDGLVLSRETGHSRDYGRNPYVGYDDADSSPFAFEGEVDDRLPAMTRVVAIEEGEATVAVPLEKLVEERVLETTVGDSDVVVWAKSGMASALDRASIADGADVGATAVFAPEVDGRRLTFRPDGEHFVDEQTGSTWNLLGEAVDGPLEGTELEPVEHLDTFWFAWASFQPDTTIVSD